MGGGTGGNFGNTIGSRLDTLSNLLTAASLIPGLDTFADLASIPVDLARGDFISAGLGALGAVPFVAISVNLGYSAYQYFSGNSSTFETPFTKGTSFTEGEQMKIFCASIGAGVLIGFSDLAINLVKRHNEKKRQKKILESHDQIIVVPFQESENTKNENLTSEQ